MRWWKALSLIFIISIGLSALASAVGLSYWAPLKSSMHAEISLDSAGQLLNFAKVAHRNVTYSFDVFWPLKPGKTTVEAHLNGIACSNNGYTIEVVTMGGKVFRGNGPLVFAFNRREPFTYFHVRIEMSPTCQVLSTKNGPVVVIDVRNS